MIQYDTSSFFDMSIMDEIKSSIKNSCILLDKIEKIANDLDTTNTKMHFKDILTDDFLYFVGRVAYRENHGRIYMSDLTFINTCIADYSSTDLERLFTEECSKITDEIYFSDFPSFMIILENISRKMEVNGYKNHSIVFYMIFNYLIFVQIVHYWLRNTINQRLINHIESYIQLFRNRWPNTIAHIEKNTTNYIEECITKFQDDKTLLKVFNGIDNDEFYLLFSIVYINRCIEAFIAWDIEEKAVSRSSDESTNENNNETSGLVDKETKLKITDDIVDISKTASECSASNSTSLDQLMSDLNELVGLESVKRDVKSLINMLKINKMKQERGLKVQPMSLHLVFTGNPGTGKTTVARLLAKLYKEIGLLSKGQLIETDRSGLVAGYIGQTATKVKEAVERSLGGVLFIDEAYTLSAGGENDFGKEAIDTLLKAMEDNRENLIVIVAGYSNRMEEFLNSNPGLQSRFNKFIEFPDYTPNEMMEIFKSMCKQSGMKLTEDALELLEPLFERIYQNRSENFANGRTVRNIYEKILTCQADRIGMIETHITDEELVSITFEDVRNTLSQISELIL